MARFSGKSGPLFFSEAVDDYSDGRYVTMALLFSAVGIKAGKVELQFLTGGIPKELNDLEKYVRVENLLIDQEQDVEVTVSVSAYCCGAGEAEPALWDDLPRIMVQMEENPNFLSEQCDHVEDVSFSFDWSQRELFGMEMEAVL